MEKHRLDMLITKELSEKYMKENPWKDCPNNCLRGELEAKYCECTEKWLAYNILDVPIRYRCKFTSVGYDVQKEKLLKSPIVVLSGQEMYAKLIAFDLANKYIEENKIAYYMVTKKNVNYNNYDEELAEEISVDMAALKFCDLVIIEDLMGERADSNFKMKITERLDNYLPTIFINYPMGVKLKDSLGEPLPDVMEYAVDGIGIKIQR